MKVKCVSRYDKKGYRMIKFSVQKNDILDALTTTAKASSTKSVISALEGIHLSLTGNQLTVTGYDLELGIKSTIDVEGESDGVLVLNSRLICDIVRKMPSGVIRFDEYEPLKLNLMCEDITYSIMGINSEEYPVLPELSRGESFEISEPLLKSVIGQTLYAVATIDTKPVLMGSKFEIKNNELNVISVDGIRIAIRKESLLHEDFDFVVPAKTLSELLRLLSDDESKIATVSVDRNQGIFSIDKYTVFSRLLEGDFFDYTKIIGMPSNIEAVVNVRELMECVDRTLLLLNDKIKSPVDFTFSDNTLRVFCETAIGKLDQKIKCDYSGEEFRISFNSRYILDALKNTYCDKVKFLFVQNTALKIVPLEGDSFTFIVSPVRRR